MMLVATSLPKLSLKSPLYMLFKYKPYLTILTNRPVDPTDSWTFFNAALVASPKLPFATSAEILTARCKA